MAQKGRMRVLIAGAGYVGSALARALATQHDVFALRRTPHANDLTGVKVVGADLRRPDSLAGLPRMDVVVVTVAADGRTPAAYRDAYVVSLSQLRSQLDRESFRPKRWLFTSSTAVYGDSRGEWLTEDSSTDPEGFTGATLLRGERIVLEVPWEGVVLRLGGIYGPDRTRLLEQVRAGVATVPPVPTYTNRIHRDDAVGALTHLVALPTPDPVYNVVDNDPAERGEVVRWLADRLDVAPPRVSDQTPTRGNKRVSNARLVAAGYRFAYPTFREGYEALIAGPGT